jgi:A/G-specific adenine glycosylase
MEKQINARLPSLLLPWYTENKRDLPWRQDKEPYHIWLSEIMLQQTRVEAVKGYYTRFLNTLPTIRDLAVCDDDVLHKLWEGLGYYSRVRNLKKAAIQIMEQYDGIFPKEYDQVRALPGIGDYTAGAICSIAFDLPTPAVDGNVLRVISRLTEDATPVDDLRYRRQVRDQLATVYPKDAGAFTQALMELGATVCGPNWAPRCEECPVKTICAAAKHGTAENYPVKKPKAKRRTEEKTVFILSCDGAYALEKRPDKGLLAGLWQFPNTEGKLEVPQAMMYLEEQGLRPREVLRQLERKHIFTHITWEMRGIYVEVMERAEKYTWLSADEIRANAAIPTAFRQFWEEMDHV